MIKHIIWNRLQFHCCHPQKHKEIDFPNRNNLFSTISEVPGTLSQLIHTKRCMTCRDFRESFVDSGPGKCGTVSWALWLGKTHLIGSRCISSLFFCRLRKMLGKKVNILSQMVVWRWFTVVKPVKHHLKEIQVFFWMVVFATPFGKSCQCLVFCGRLHDFLPPSQKMQKTHWCISWDAQPFPRKQWQLKV